MQKKRARWRIRIVRNWTVIAAVMALAFLTNFGVYLTRSTSLNAEMATEPDSVPIEIYQPIVETDEEWLEARSHASDLPDLDAILEFPIRLETEYNASEDYETDISYLIAEEEPLMRPEPTVESNSNSDLAPAAPVTIELSELRSLIADIQAEAEPQPVKENSEASIVDILQALTAFITALAGLIGIIKGVKPERVKHDEEDDENEDED